jgi:hypothetical protein
MHTALVLSMDSRGSRSGLCLDWFGGSLDKRFLTTVFFNLVSDKPVSSKPVSSKPDLIAPGLVDEFLLKSAAMSWG